jgi:hypothetical protein
MVTNGETTMLETIPHSSGYEIGYTSIYGMNKNFRHVSNVSYHRVLLVAPWPSIL